VIKYRRLRWVVHVAIKEEARSIFKALSGKFRGRPRRRWKDKIQMGLKEIVVNTELG
jgi:hypothetical protein